jgi:uncharacterized cupin superfamily protein
VDEAPLRETPAGLVPQGDGWFVLNARDAVWLERDGFGSRCGFEADGRVAAELGVEPQLFPQLGFKLAVIEPGQRSTLYHAETSQEDFLVLEGECLAIVEEQERHLKAWDLLHCPPGTRHAFVNDGTVACVLLMVGARREGATILYPESEVAARHGAAVEQETSSPAEAYAPFGHWRPLGGGGPKL